MWLRAIIWLNCLIGGCAMIPPLANIVEIPTAVTLVSGKRFQESSQQNANCRRFQ